MSMKSFIMRNWPVVPRGKLETHCRAGRVEGPGLWLQLRPTHGGMPSPSGDTPPCPEAGQLIIQAHRDLLG